MKIFKSSGCVYGDFKIDGKHTNDYSLDDQKEILKKIFDKIIEEGENVNEYAWLIEDLLDYVKPLTCDIDEEPCEQCGDTYMETTWEI